MMSDYKGYKLKTEATIRNPPQHDVSTTCTAAYGIVHETDT